MPAKRLVIIIVGLVLLGAAALFGYRAYLARQAVPAGLFASNGRIEATEIDIATKLAGRIAQVLVDEGDLVQKGQVLAQMDVEDLRSGLAAAEAQAQQARNARDQAAHMVEVRQGELTLAEKNVERNQPLFDKGFSTAQTLDQLNTSRVTAQAALSAAQSSVAASDAAIRAADAEVARLRRTVEDGTLVAPRSGRVLYRLAEPGEVLAAGGKVLTVLDLSDVYMTVFLPASYAGRLAIGADARLLLEPIPAMAIPARVIFVASRAQYTPKQVETQSERDRMVFRTKVQIPPELVQRYIEQAKTGVTGMAYLKLDPTVAWPAWLESELTRPKAAP